MATTDRPDTTGKGRCWVVFHAGGLGIPFVCRTGWPPRANSTPLRLRTCRVPEVCVPAFGAALHMSGCAVQYVLFSSGRCGRRSVLMLSLRSTSPHR